MHLVYSGAHLKYTDIVYTKRINEIYAVAHTIVLQPLLHSVVCDGAVQKHDMWCVMV